MCLDTSSIEKVFGEVDSSVRKEARLPHVVAGNERNFAFLADHPDVVPNSGPEAGRVRDGPPVKFPRVGEVETCGCVYGSSESIDVAGENSFWGSSPQLLAHAGDSTASANASSVGNRHRGSIDNWVAGVAPESGRSCPRSIQTDGNP
jgi:hypothetical protein